MHSRYQPCSSRASEYWVVCFTLIRNRDENSHFCKLEAAIWRAQPVGRAKAADSSALALRRHCQVHSATLPLAHWGLQGPGLKTPDW